MKNNNGGVKLYVGMHDGVCVLTSGDDGRTWEQGAVTPLAHAAARLSVSPTEPHRAYLAAYEAGLYSSDDGGQTWRHASSYPSDYAHSVAVHPEDSKTVYVGSEPSAIYRSRDAGETWEECAAFRAVPEPGQWSFHDLDPRVHHVRDLRMTPNGPNRLYAGIEVGGVVRSGDSGESWQQLHGTDDDIHCIDVSRARPGTVYVATNSGPYRSDDEGQSWEPIKEGLARTYSVHIAAAPDDAEVVLVTVATGPGRQNPQFYRSSSGGRQWQLVDSAGSDDDMVVAMDWDPHEPNRCYAATDHGNIYCSADRGKSWSPLPVKLPTVALGCLVVARA